MIGTMRDAYLNPSEAADVRWNLLQAQPDGSGLLTIRSPDQDLTAWVSPETMQLIHHAYRIESPSRSFTGDICIFNPDPSYIISRINAVAKTAGLDVHYTGDSPRHGMMMDLLLAGSDSSRIAVDARLEIARTGSFHAIWQVVPRPPRQAIVRIHQRTAFIRCGYLQQALVVWPSPEPPRQQL